MQNFDELLRAFRTQVTLPWRDDVPPAGRVWVLWYDKTMQRRITARRHTFESVTRAAGHGWRQIDISDDFGHWVAGHELFEPLLEQPDELPTVLSDYEAHLTAHLHTALAECNANDLLAVDGCGALFGLVRVSGLLNRVVDAIPGRLLLFFPGQHRNGVYRLLDARDGWNYHAVPIPPASAF